MFDRFDTDARRVLVAARDEAAAFGSLRVEATHMLCAMATLADTDAGSILGALGLDAGTVRDICLGELDGDSGLYVATRSLPLGESARAACELALARVSTLGAPSDTLVHVGSAALLSGAAYQPEVATALECAGYDCVQLRSAAEVVTIAVVKGYADKVIRRMFGTAGVASDPSGDDAGPDSAAATAAGDGTAVADPGTDDTTDRRPAELKALTAYGRDLTAAAADGTIAACVGRDREVARVVDVLCRRTKNNVVLTGPAGVGKTAIAEGVAAAIAAGTAPRQLAASRVFSIDIGLMLSGTTLRGQFEQRLTGVIAEATAHDIVLFIDELHTVVGAGDRNGGHDAANLLKPALARGELRVIGATTDDEYRAHIERDPALERRFTKVAVGEPDTDAAVAICTATLDALRAHHDVAFAEDAATAAVVLTDRHVPGRNLPDKALDALDEAAVAAARAGTDVTADTIAAVISGWTNTAITARALDARAALDGLADTLAGAVVAQRHATDAIAATVRRHGAGLAAPHRPAASFLLCGPSGVGKSETAKALAATLFGTPDALVVVDMAEFAEAHTTSKLIGAPAGYVGYGEPGRLTEPVRRRPHCVVLLDELDKAHPACWDLLLGILEEGRLHDGAGRPVDFTNAVVLCTANLGAGALTGPRPGFAAAVRPDPDAARAAAVAEARRALRPELVNRFDDVVAYTPLDDEALAAIAAKMLADLAGRAAASGVELTWTSAACATLAGAGHDPALGARPLRRMVDGVVADAVADAVLAGDTGPLVVDVDAAGAIDVLPAS